VEHEGLKIPALKFMGKTTTAHISSVFKTHRPMSVGLSIIKEGSQMDGGLPLTWGIEYIVSLLNRIIISGRPF